MNAVFSIILLAVALGAIVLLLTRRENTRRSQYGPTGLNEFRTDLPLDDCFDRLDEHKDTDEFRVRVPPRERRRLPAHLTLHQPTQQPLDTLYTLRFDPGRQTIVTPLIFIREALGLQGAALPAGNAGPLPDAKLDAHRTKIIFAKNRFSFPRLFCYTTCSTPPGCGGALRVSSSAGQSWRLITAWSRVQVLPGP